MDYVTLMARNINHRVTRIAGNKNSGNLVPKKAADKCKNKKKNETKINYNQSVSSPKCFRNLNHHYGTINFKIRTD